MQIGTHVRLRDRPCFRDSQPDLSEAVGAVSDFREEDGHEFVSVIFHEHHVLAPDVPIEFLEVARLC